MGVDDFFHTGLVLGLGLSSSSSSAPQKLNRLQVKVNEPELTLCRLSGSVGHSGGASSLSVKRERESDEYYDENDGDRSNVGRKKLRLSKAQAALLEDYFKHHTTLNHKQKQDLARELKLRPRQVEVWFQNRRARSKLKQTEVECEFLKKCFETLTVENRRLQKELRALKVANPIYMQLSAPAAKLTVCPACENVSAKSAFKMAPNRHLYSPFPNHPSAAC